MGRDFRKWERGGESYDLGMGEGGKQKGFFDCGIVDRIHSKKCVYIKALTMNSCSGICPRLEKILGVLVGRTSSPLPVTDLRRD